MSPVILIYPLVMKTAPHQYLIYNKIISMSQIFRNNHISRNNYSKKINYLIFIKGYLIASNKRRGRLFKGGVYTREAFITKIRESYNSIYQRQ